MPRRKQVNKSVPFKKEEGCPAEAITVMTNIIWFVKGLILTA